MSRPFDRTIDRSHPDFTLYEVRFRVALPSGLADDYVERWLCRELGEPIAVDGPLATQELRAIPASVSVERSER